ncbi:MAG: uncharacterized membrane protein YkvA (DUF1232 family) [Saprospiraceae bacterium]|jgi:uncharacterized membrane protein YkvA (DUF1232 family)
MDNNLKNENPKDESSDNSNKDSESTENEEKIGEPEIPSEEEIRYKDFYVRLRGRINKQLKDSYNTDSPINKVINLTALLPDLLHLNIKLLFDGNVSAEKKGAILGAIIYVISPIDLIPDILPAFGWLDDLIVITIGLNALFDDEKDEYIRKAVNRYWAGEDSVFDATKHIVDILDNAVEFLPRKVLKIIKDLLRGK